MAGPAQPGVLSRALAWFRARSPLTRVAIVAAGVLGVGLASLPGGDDPRAISTGGSSGVEGIAGPRAASDGDGSARAPETRAPARSIAGLTVTEATRPLARRGFRCDGPRPTPTQFEWTCARVTPRAEERLIVLASDPHLVASLSASVVGRGGKPAARRVERFLGIVASVRYRRADPLRAVRWVRRRAAQGGTVGIGAARLTLSRNRRDTWTLELVPR